MQYILIFSTGYAIPLSNCSCYCVYRWLNIKTLFKKEDFPADKAGELGTFLGINHGRISTLKSNNVGNADEMLSAILSEWLNNDSEKSWEKLAKALRNLSHSLIADKIEKGETILLGGMYRTT